jgi:hypothetical protein
MIVPLSHDTADPNTPLSSGREFGSREPATERPDALKPPVSAAEPAKQDRIVPGPSPARTALTRSAPRQEKPNGFERAIGVVKAVLPIVGKMLPLLEGNVISAASNLLVNRGPHAVDLGRLETAIGKLQAAQREQRLSTAEQRDGLKRLEEELAAVQGAVKRNSAEQAEMLEALLSLRKRMSTFMRFVMVLLIVSIGFTVLLCVRLAYILKL